ncbi:MAG: NADH:ubiquinone reductase (Na(+)-transporting) subunit C [Odoribacteraceae bacterium]|jgi:Na+-transporting NADH:ubiquinone oxidoreductase subunit C|nr:NADH:ubiquinone reductase (Na(+)-transporting) subunit C [Odoribacteraceae bacterium]
MNKEGNRYTFLFSVVMVLVVAIVLTLVSTGLQPRQNANVENEKRQNILSSVKVNVSREASAGAFDTYITRQIVVNSRGEEVAGDAFAIDMGKEMKKAPAERLLPVFIARVNGETKYIFPTRGTGLWGPLWGYVSLNEDKNTIFGAVFDHKGETPGLGAEITHEEFRSQFDGKQIFEGDKLVAVRVEKGGKAAGPHEVDAISGGTITSKGVEAMLLDNLTCYESFLRQTLP